MKSVLLFDLDNELNAIEAIFYKYVKLPDGLRFIKNNRFPVMTKDYPNLDTYIDHGLVSDKPYHPFLCIECVCELLLSKIYAESGIENLFIRNPKLSRSKSFITEDLLYCDPVGRILEYFPNIYKGQNARPASKIVGRKRLVDKCGRQMFYAIDQDNELWSTPTGYLSEDNEAVIPTTEYRTSNPMYATEEFINDIKHINHLINLIYENKIKRLLYPYPDNIVQFKYDTGKVELYINGNIAAYRFNELL